MKRVACPQIICYIFIAPAIICIFLLFVALVACSESDVIFPYFFIAFFYPFFVIVCSLIHRNAFVQVELSENGLSNRFMQVSWKDIENYSIIDVNIGWYPKWVSVECLCVGNLTQRQFPLINPRNTIVIGIDRKTKDYIHRFAGDKIIL